MQIELTEEEYALVLKALRITEDHFYLAIDGEPYGELCNRLEVRAESERREG